MSDSNPDKMYKHFSAFLLGAMAFLIFYIAYSDESGSALDFGDDSSALALNDECTDVRFRGPGMGPIGPDALAANDATDCASLFAAGSIFLSSVEATQAIALIDFGDDEGGWPEDGECDDPRFEGEEVAFGAEDMRHDATDCRTLMYQGAITFGGEPEVMIQDGIDFGDDFGGYAGDGECDDTRFSGPGMASADSFSADNIGHDATDCFALYNDGRIVLQTLQIIDGIDFGDNSSDWADDGECDDPRFIGEGMASSQLEEDALRDAADCRSLYLADAITYIGDSGEGITVVGDLAATDDEMEPGKFADFYAIEGSANQRAVFDLVSEDFDTYLLVMTPGGEEFTNDDFDGDINRSLLSMILPEVGTYQVWVTSYSEGETGNYTLRVQGEGIVGDALIER
jgi:hypothetical protein